MKSWQTWLTGVLTVLSLGMCGALAYDKLGADCCETGGPCCTAGAACCAGHSHAHKD